MLMVPMLSMLLVAMKCNESNTFLDHDDDVDQDVDDDDDDDVDLYVVNESTF